MGGSTTTYIGISKWALNTHQGAMRGGWGESLLQVSMGLGCPERGGDPSIRAAWVPHPHPRTREQSRGPF